MKITKSDDDSMRTDSYCDEGKFGEAIELIDQQLRMEPGKAKLWARRGWCRFSKGDFRNAIADFDEALVRKPVASTTLYFRARSWEQLGDLDKAMSDYSESIAIRPKADALIARGLIRKYRKRQCRCEVRL